MTKSDEYERTAALHAAGIGSTRSDMTIETPLSASEADLMDGLFGPDLRALTRQARAVDECRRIAHAKWTEQARR